MSLRTRVLVAAAVTAAAVTATTLPASGGAAAPADPPGITWWALGDSYSSGEGLEYNDFDANPPDTNCERATGGSSVGPGSKAYSVVATEQLFGVDEFRLLACTGAITNQWREQWMETDGRRADLVTLSFGGNNVGFSDVIKGCAGLSVGGGINAVVGGATLWSLNPALGCRESREELDRRVDMLVGNGPNPNEAFEGSQTLPDMYAEIAAEAVTPGGHVVVLGYPNLVEEPGRWTWRLLAGNRCHRIRRADAVMLRGATGYLNQQIALAVERANDNPYGVTFHFLDVSQVYESAEGRHGLCTGSPWLNGLTVGTRGPDDGPIPIRAYRSFHPNQFGHDATGTALARLVRTFDWGGLAATPPTVDPTAFVGTWTGTIQGAGRRFTADVSLELADGRLSGTIVHPDLPCFGSTTEIAREGDQVLLDTVYTEDSNCIDGGTHRLTALGPDELRYEWLAPDSNRIDSGTLRRAATPPPPPVTEPTGNVVITPAAAGGRSVFSSEYGAEITSVTTRDRFLVDVGFTALGRSDLRRPETSCLVSDSGRVATPIAQTLTVDASGEFRGTWTFPLIESGTWSLQYSCRPDYSLAPVATATVPAIGVSSYSAEYSATLLGATRRADGSVEVQFVSHGNERSENELRDPATSCLVADGRAITPISISLLSETPGEFYEGTLVFALVPDVALQFVYSCQNDYTAVAL